MIPIARRVLRTSQNLALIDRNHFCTSSYIIARHLSTQSPRLEESHAVKAQDVSVEDARKIKGSNLKVAKPYLAPNPAAPKMLTLWPLVQRFPIMKKVILSLAKLAGFNNSTSIAIRNTSHMFDTISRWAFDERAWVYDEAFLPMTFQTWFSITNLHVWILTTRFRALPPSISRVFEQELVNHFFAEAEKRIRGQFNVTSDSQIKKYMKNFQQEWRGANIMYDYSLTQAQSDTHLASALWRNIWMEGAQPAGIHKETSLLGRTEEECEIDPLLATIHLEKLVIHVRKEIQRLSLLSDSDIIKGAIGSFRKITTEKASHKQ